MPTLIHCSKSGDHKARIAALPFGGYTYAESRGEAHGLYYAARRMGCRVSVQTMRPDVLRVTLLHGKSPNPPNLLTANPR